MLDSLFNIKKRLGGERYKEVKSIMEQSFVSNDKKLHKNWIKKVLTYYYDPLYEYKMQKRKHYISFKGSLKEVKNYLKNLGVK